jgi:hypothetical protein
MLLRRTLGCLAITALSLASGAMAQTTGSKHPLTVYWNVHTDEMDLAFGSKTDWAAQLNTGQVQVERSIQIFYEHHFGIFPKEGPQAFSTNPQLMSQHLATLRARVVQQIPDPSYSGLAIIDYESWNPMWEVNPPGIQSAWKAHLESLSPSPLRGVTGADEERVCRTTYEAAARQFFEVTLDTARALRPSAKWSLYDYPCAYAQCEWVYENVPNKYTQRNDRLRWLWDKLDVFTPSIYAWRVTLQNPSQTRTYDCSEEEQRRFVRGLVNECYRLDPQKPIYAYFWSQIGATAGPHEGFLNDLTVTTAVDELSRSRAKGMVFWGVLKNTTEKDQLQTFLSQKLLPQLRAVAPAPAPEGPAAQPPASSGSGGLVLPRTQQSPRVTKRTAGTDWSRLTKKTSVKAMPATSRPSVGGSARQPVDRSAPRSIAGFPVPPKSWGSRRTSRTADVPPQE